MTKLELAITLLKDIAEGDCAYGDYCPDFPGFGPRHGRCYPCQARNALEQIRDHKEEPPEDRRCGTCHYFDKGGIILDEHTVLHDCTFNLSSILETTTKLTENSGKDCEGWKAREK